MPYSILTRDGIQITSIPNDIPSDSEILKSRVAEERRKLQIVVSQDVVTEPSGVPGGTVEEQTMAAESELPTLDTAGCWREALLVVYPARYLELPLDLWLQL